ncbi:MAG TPA: diacylglycerol kinase family protein [Anaerolineales bacterium]|jgi:diacylglycerol kinase (ATP)|nr:diacylglycerol kinase family protein [Anaerolineales bacterium]
MKIKILLNPYSNRWNSQQRWTEAESALRATQLDFDLSVSEHADHLVDLAADAVRGGYSTLIIAGGDGSVGEVVNGTARGWNEKSAFPVTLGILPLGTANDLADNIGIPRDLASAAKVISNGKTRRVDLGKCNERYFLNNSGAGLEPYVTTKQEKIKWISGVPRYLVAAVQGIMDKPTWHARLEWDDGSYEGPLSLVSIGNGYRTGGIFFMTPHADPFDGKLTFVHGYRATRLGLFQALPRAMKPGEGSFVEMDGMYEIHCTHLKIRFDKPSPVHTDGELFDEWLTDLEYKIFPSCVQMLVP